LIDMSTHTLDRADGSDDEASDDVTSDDGTSDDDPVVTMVVNGRRERLRVPGRLSLADALRERLHLTGTHLGCEHGVCGACTVRLDGAPVRSCITLAAACDGHEVVTVEGLEGPAAESVREAFSAEHGLQCGFCTPGMLVTALDIVTRLPDASPDVIRLELGGNLCRCTGYVNIVRAVARAARELGAPAAAHAAGPAGDRP
jgi:carbon-monoxide dehydrogenase small subunit